jgi:hypothetical protein
MVVANRLTLDEFWRIEDPKPALEDTSGEVTQKPIPSWSNLSLPGGTAVSVLGANWPGPSGHGVPLHLWPFGTTARVCA